MKVTKHAEKRMSERLGNIIGDPELQARIAFKKGYTLPKNLKEIYIKSIQNRPSIYKIWRNCVFVYNEKGNVLITVIKYV